MLVSDVHRLDEAIEAIDEASDSAQSPCALLREHVEAARASRLGEMIAEYELNLGMALEAIDCIADEARRGRVKQMLEDLLREIEHK